jgi:hypothetical protein
VNWLLANKEWLFSGVGIAIVSAVIYVVRHVWPSKRKGESGTNVANAATRSTSRPLPAEICAATTAAPPLHQDTRVQEYVGLQVHWLVSLHSAHRRDQGTARLMLLDRGNYPWVNCEVPIGDYPELLIASVGTNFWIAGKIKKVEGATIELEEARLTPAE